MYITEFVIATVLYAVNITLSLYIFRPSLSFKMAGFLIFTICTPIFALACLIEPSETAVKEYGYTCMILGGVIFIRILVHCIADFMDGYNKDLWKRKPTVNSPNETNH